MHCTCLNASQWTAFTKMYVIHIINAEHTLITCKSSSLESGSTITDVHSLSNISALLLRCRCHPERVDTSLTPQPQMISHYTVCMVVFYRVCIGSVTTNSNKQQPYTGWDIKLDFVMVSSL